jgi:hypothetical protein
LGKKNIHAQIAMGKTWITNVIATGFEMEDDFIID